MAGRRLDEYKPLAFYKANTKAKQSGFSKFDVDGAYFFCRYVDGKIAMISQAYTGASGRDNGIVSVKNNEKTTGRYRFEDRDSGKFGFSLRAGNSQEIAVSPDYASAKAAQNAAGRLTGRTKAKAKTTAPKKAVAAKAKAKPIAKATSKGGRIENYKPLAFYEKHGGKAAGFNKFDEGGAYYFNYAQSGKVVLISEAYTAARGRDNGIASVKKNMKLEKRYQFHKHKNGKHYFDINAANHQEIATSRWYDSASAAKTGAGHVRNGLSKPVVKKAAPKKAAPKKAAPKKASGTKTAAAAAGLTAGAALAARKPNVEQNYKPLDFYTRQTKGRKDGIESFKGDDGEHYFAVFENNEIAMISEGYPTTAARDTGVASVEKNIGIADRYDYRTLKNGKYDYRLKAGNHKEIARSVWYGSAAAATAGAAYLIGARKRVPKVAPKAAAPIAAVAATTMAAAAVAAPASPPVPTVTPVPTPTPTPAPMPVPTPAPLPKPEPIAPVAVEEVGGGGIWGWLKWLLLALLALLAIFWLFSCMGDRGGKAESAKAAAAGTATTAPAVAANVPPVMISCWDGSKAETEGACPTRVTCADGTFAATRSACPKPAPRMMTCWDGSRVEDLDDCPVEPAPEPMPEPEPVSTRAAMTSGTAVAGMTAGPFVAGLTPVIVRKLGTNVEFGDSRGLTGAEFYNKLDARYRTNEPDRAYLDFLAKELGYTGWSDLSASDFTEATVANGTTGVLGFGDYHGYQYSTLDVGDVSDLDAFRFRSLNGREVYFMKRCGNFFFPTE